MSNNRVSLLDRLLAIPIAIYFWCYEHRQQGRPDKKKEVH